MNCPNCIDNPLRAKQTKQGPQVDFCGRCKGVWLNPASKVFKFVRHPEAVSRALKQAVAEGKPSQLMSPAVQLPMNSISIPDQDLVLHFCHTSKGLWFAGGQLTTLGKAEFNHVGVAQPVEPSSPPSGVASEPAGAVKQQTADPEPGKTTSESDPAIPGKNLKKAAARGGLPDLETYSWRPFAIQYVMLSVVLISFSVSTDVPVSLVVEFIVVLALLQFTAASFLMDKCLGFFFPLEWLEPEKLPKHLQDFISRVCQEKGLGFPKIGLIYDGSPNAFIYGKKAQMSRLVLTKGLLNLLTREEVEAVVAHQLGQLNNKSLSWMTLSQVPAFFFLYIYHSLIEMPEARVDGRNTRLMGTIPGRLRFFFAYLIYCFYAVLQFSVLELSRLRQLHGDESACEATNNPHALATALVKVSYGMGGVDRMAKTLLWCETCQVALAPMQIYNGLCRTCDKPISNKEVRREPRSSMVDVIGAFGVVDPRMAKAFSASTYSAVEEGRHFEGHYASALESWVDWETGPWGRYFERVSTHPALSRRLAHLGELAKNQGQASLVADPTFMMEDIPPEVKSHVWKLWLPRLVMGVWLIPSLFLAPLWLAGIPLLVLAFSLGTHIRRAYDDELFPMMEIEKTLANDEMSLFIAAPVKVTGQLFGVAQNKPMGFGDFVIRDSTGVLFVDYRTPTHFWEFVFGFFRGRDMQGEDVRIAGWLRKGPVPYIEVESLKSHGKTLRSNALTIQKVACFLSGLLGLLALATITL